MSAPGSGAAALRGEDTPRGGRTLLPGADAAHVSVPAGVGAARPCSGRYASAQQLSSINMLLSWWQHCLSVSAIFNKAAEMFTASDSAQIKAAGDQALSLQHVRVSNLSGGGVNAGLGGAQRHSHSYQNLERRRVAPADALMVSRGRGGALRVHEVLTEQGRSTRG